jgi:S1-C subfamily serine protease
MLQTFKCFSVTTLRNCATYVRRIFGQCAASLILLVLIPFVEGQNSDIAKGIETAKKTVAPIVCLVNNSNGKGVTRFRILGTAFIVDASGIFVTANHVISDFLTSPWKDVCVSAVTFPTAGWKRVDQDVQWLGFDTSKCQINTNFDVAVCKTVDDLSKKNVSYEVASISSDKPADGTTIFFTGFPLQATDPITSIGAIAGFSAQDGYNTILIDKNAWPGASGSPIYVPDGKKVIGMLLKTGAGDAAGLSFGVVGEKISAILPGAVDNWKKAEEQQKTQQH